jgi:multidrug efflux pump subunit AcrB
MALMMLKQETIKTQTTSFFHSIHLKFDQGFERMRATYLAGLSALLVRRKSFASAFFSFTIASCGLFLILGEDFFPAVDAGQIRLHMRAPSGTRIEETARLADQVENAIRQIIPPAELDTVLENIGVTISSINI